MIGPLEEGEESKTLADKGLNGTINMDCLPLNIPLEMRNLIQTLSFTNEHDLLVSLWNNSGKFDNKLLSLTFKTNTRDTQKSLMEN